MVIGNLHVSRSAIFPIETDAPLLVDANGVLPGSITAQLLQAVPRRRKEVPQVLRLVKVDQLAPRSFLNCWRQLPRLASFKNVSGFITRKTLDHCQTISRRVTIDKPRRVKKTPVQWIITSTSRSILAYAAANHASVERASRWPMFAENRIGDTPLIVAARKGYKEVIDALLAAKADVEVSNAGGATALAAAVSSNKEDVVAFLIAHQADVNVQDKAGWTPLHRAAAGNLKEIADLLLAKGAKIDAIDHNGETPLYVAADKGNKEVVELLLANKADVNLKTYDGTTPLRCAVKSGNAGVADIIRRYGGHE